jgi:hypothetical protein
MNNHGNDIKSVTLLSAKTEPNFNNIDKRGKKDDNLASTQKSSRN